MSDRIFTAEEDAYFTKEVNAYQLPAFTRFFNTLWFGFFKYYVFVIFCIIFVGACVANFVRLSDNTHLVLFTTLKYLFFSSFGIGLWAAGSFIVKEQGIKNRAKELGLTLEEWNSFLIQ